MLLLNPTNINYYIIERVVKEGGNKFTFNIFCMIPNYSILFKEKYTYYVLTYKDLLILQDFTNYELTLFEQLYLDFFLNLL